MAVGTNSDELPARRQPARRGQAPRVPASTFAVLGLLSFGEMSGYDVAKLVERSVGHFFSPAKSQIYGELRRLVELGYASEREVSQEQRPDKRLYRMTANGERGLREWLESSPLEPDTYKSTFLLKLFFGELMDHDALVRQVREYRREARERLAEFEETERTIAANPEFRYPYLTLRAGLASARATVRWTDEVLAELGAKAKR